MNPFARDFRYHLGVFVLENSIFPTVSSKIHVFTKGLPRKEFTVIGVAVFTFSLRFNNFRLFELDKLF